MVVVDKILKLGGFLDTALVQRLGFARKTLPPDTPHDETRQRFAVVNGQKVKTDMHADPETKRSEREKQLEKEEKESERCDLARTLATLAEKHSDFAAADAVLHTMRTDKSVEVRRTAAAYLAFSTKRPREPISVHVVKGMYDALDDEDQTVRFYAAESVNGSIREADGLAIDQSIQPQVKGQLGRMASMLSRDFAWSQARDFVQCVRNRKLNEALLSALTHHTLSVRMATWEAIALLCRKDCLKETREVEAQCHKAHLVLKKKKKHWTKLNHQREKKEEQLKDEGRERVRIQMEEKAALEGIVIDDYLAEEMRSKMLGDILGESEEFTAMLDAEDKAHTDKEASERELQQVTSAYQHLNSKAEELLIAILINVSQEGSKPVQVVNDRLGYLQRGNWYVRRAIVRCFFPLAHAGDTRALAILGQSLEDPSPYVQRAAQKELGTIRKIKLDKQRAEAVRRQRLQQEEALGIKHHHDHVLDAPTSPIWPPSKAASPSGDKPKTSLQWGEDKSHGGGGGERKPETGVTSQRVSVYDSKPMLFDEAPDWLQKEEVSNDLSSLAQQFEKQATAEDERKKKKKKKALSQLKKEAERIRLLDMAENSTEDVVAFLFKLRDEVDPKLIDNVCARMRADQTTGAEIAKWGESEWKNRGFALNKNRNVLMKALRDMQEQHFQATNPGALAEAAARAREEAAVELAKESAELEKEKARIKLASEARLRAARRGDTEFGGDSGLKCVIFRDSQGQLYLQSVKPCGGHVNEGDTLLKVGEKEVTGMTLLEVRDLLREHGQMCPCLVRLTSQKERMAQIKRDRASAEQLRAAGSGASVVKAQKKKKKDPKAASMLGRFGFGKKQQEVAKEEDDDEEEEYEGGRGPTEGSQQAALPPGDLLRSVQISHVPVAFKDQYLESIGLDVEVYVGDATRSLQVIMLLQRNGFGDYINRILVELGIKQLKDLAQQFCYPEWIASVGLTRYEEKKFSTLLRRLAVRFQLSDPRSAVTSEQRRPNAHESWRFIQARAGKSERVVESTHRKTDKTISLEGFAEQGTTAVPLKFEFKGLDYTILWHEALNLYIELMHTSTGPFRMMRKNEDGDAPAPLDPSQPDVRVFTVFGDGSLEAASDLRAPELLKEVSRVRAGGIPHSFPPNPDGNSEEDTKHSARTGMLSDSFAESQVDSMRRIRRNQRKNSMGSSRMIDRMASTESASMGPFHQSMLGFSRERSAGGILKDTSTSFFDYDDSSWNFADNYNQNSTGMFGVGATAFASTKKLKLGSVMFSEEMEDHEGFKRAGSGSGKIKRTGLVSARNFGIMTFLDSVLGGKKERQVAEDEEIGEDEDAVIGFHVQPEVGMRVLLRPKIAEMHPDLLEDSGGGGGAITWVDDDDADGDGFVGDICEVRWDTGHVADYKTGYEGAYRLVLEGGAGAAAAGGEGKGAAGALAKGGKLRTQSPDDIYRDSDEKVVGLDVVPVEGMRVVVRKIAIAENPDLLLDSGGGQGTITWVDPDDADGDGITGDICEVEWDHSGERKDYRTGFESCFRLAQYIPPPDPKRISTADRELLQTGSTATAATDDRPASGKPKEKKRRRHRIRTRDEGREPPPDNPWEALEEALRLAREMEKPPPAAEDRRSDPTRLEGEGKNAELRAGNFHLATEPHAEFGTTIRVSFSSGIKRDPDKARDDALRLGLKFGGTERKGFVDGSRPICGFGEDKATELHLTGDGLIGFADGDSSAVVVSSEGLRFVTRQEGELLLEGVPASMVQEVIQARSQAINVMSDSEPSSQTSSRPVSGRPSSRRSRVSEARPTTPGTNRPYSASRPSTKGSVRHLLNVDDVSMGTQELQAIEGRQHCLLDDEHALRVSHAAQGNLLFASDHPSREAVPPQG